MRKNFFLHNILHGIRADFIPLSKNKTLTTYIFSKP
uniref:Uncharacterized protein n=1 Tax=Rhizophora mucronata TaxID=61149 RepID=A0A2P2N664_RHIMU